MESIDRPLSELDGCSHAAACKPAASPVMAHPVLRAACFDDYEQIAALEERNGLSSKPREEWLHLWQSNPAYHYHTRCPVGWVLEKRSGEIVGALQNVPCLYRFAGQTYIACFGRGWAVDVEYRAFSLLLLKQQIKQLQVALLLTSTAVAKTASVLPTQGWSRVPRGEWDRSALWVTNYVQAAQCCIKAKLPRWLAAVTGALAYAPLAGADLVSARPRRLKVNCELGWSAAFDSRFDQFWADLENEHSQVLLAMRDSRTLNWHFQYALQQNRLWILTASQGPRMVAYAVLERRNTRSFDLARMFLVDFQSIASDRNLATAMMGFALDRCRREGIHILENTGCWLEKGHRFLPRPAYRRKLESWCYFYRATNAALTEPLKSAPAWYPTQYDTDASL